MLDINKKFKTDIIRKGTDTIYVEKIPFNSPRANYMTYGGVPKGKATEFFGPEGGGKTTSALQIVAQAQKSCLAAWTTQVAQLHSRSEELAEKDTKSAKDEVKKILSDIAVLTENGPRKCVYVDAENTLDEDWAELNGVDTNDLYLVRPENQTAEEVFQMILDLLNTGLIEVLVLDSIPVLVGQNIYDEDVSKKSYGGISGPLTQFTTKCKEPLTKFHTAFIGINQVRDDFNNPFNQFHSPGGRAWKHFCALRMFFRKGAFIDADNVELKNSAAEPSGNLVDVTVVKTKVCKPDRRIGQYTLKYDSGADVLGDTVFMAIKFDFIVQSGSWFNIMDPSTGDILSDGENDLKFQGKPKLLEYLRQDDEIFGEILEAVNEKLQEE